MRGKYLPSRPTYQRLVLSKALETKEPPPVQMDVRLRLLKPATTLLLCLALIALCGYAFWQQRTIASLNRKIVWLKQHAAPAVPPSSAGATVNEVKTIVCPLCHGEKVVVYGEDLLHRTRQKCPVCKGVGYRTLKIPAGHKICPDCQGMGIVYYPYQPRQPIRLADCARCEGTGLIATFEQVADNRSN